MIFYMPSAIKITVLLPFQCFCSIFFFLALLHYLRLLEQCGSDEYKNPHHFLTLQKSIQSFPVSYVFSPSISSRAEFFVHQLRW